MPIIAEGAASLVPSNWVTSQGVPPLASSEGLRWRGMAVYRFRYPAHDRLETTLGSGHFVSAHISCPCQLSARWSGAVHRSRSNPGDTIIIGPRQRVLWDWWGAFDEVQMFIDPTRLALAAAEITDRPFSLIEGISIPDPFVYSLARRIVDELAHAAAGTACFGDVFADTLIWHLLRTRSTLRHPDAVDRIDMPAHKVKMAVEFMNSHFAEDVSVGDIASAVSMSSSRFTRGFRKATGQSPYQFLLQKRIETAQDLLRSTSQSLADIARAVGFATQSQFTSAFRRRCQTTPGKYRDRARPLITRRR